jgi:23S rRNA (guanosine2251-2'-O)-methyltransferase
MSKNQLKRPRRNNTVTKHQLNWLWGHSSVFDTLTAGRWRVYELYVTEQIAMQNAERFAVAKENGTEIHIADEAKLTELSGARDHQGIVARVSKYPYLTMDQFPELIKRTSDTEKSLLPLVVVADRIQDPLQFAALLRCCDAAGVSAMVIGEHCQAQVTTQIARASLGAVNHFPIVQCGDLPVAAAQIKELGCSLVAIDSASETSLGEAKLDVPLALLLGSETLGLNPLLASLCDIQVRIPSFGNHVSLHAAVAAGVVLYETRRQQSASHDRIVPCTTNP